MKWYYKVNLLKSKIKNQKKNQIAEKGAFGLGSYTSIGVKQMKLLDISSGAHRHI